MLDKLSKVHFRANAPLRGAAETGTFQVHPKQPPGPRPSGANLLGWTSQGLTIGLDDIAKLFDDLLKSCLIQGPHRSR